MDYFTPEEIQRFKNYKHQSSATILEVFVQKNVFSHIEPLFPPVLPSPSRIYRKCRRTQSA